MSVTQVRDGMHLHVRTCTPLFHISRTVRRIVLKFGMWLGTRLVSHESNVGPICTCVVRTCTPLPHVGAFEVARSSLIKAPYLNPPQHRPFRILPRRKGGGGGTISILPLIELELRRKNERVARRETKRLVYKLKVLGQPVASEVRSSAEKRRKPVIADNFASDGARRKFQRPASSLR